MLLGIIKFEQMTSVFIRVAIYVTTSPGPTSLFEIICGPPSLNFNLLTVEIIFCGFNSSGIISM